MWLILDKILVVLIVSWAFWYLSKGMFKKIPSMTACASKCFKKNHHAPKALVVINKKAR